MVHVVNGIMNYKRLQFKSDEKMINFTSGKSLLRIHCDLKLNNFEKVGIMN